MEITLSKRRVEVNDISIPGALYEDGTEPGGVK
jgi:hypothetical protein